ncbi:MAG: AbrB/MazE/SpoVT family DNA-binding domain-containing protein [Anaerolineales bacterium]|nr:AbrB/MazE/SpoVT family DNA-binding domain-containing protein [Anaerolineales bacterium]
MFRILFKIGYGVLVSLPKEIIELLGISKVTDVSIELDRENKRIIIQPAKQPIAGSISEDFSRQVADFIEEYRPALEALANNAL